MNFGLFRCLGAINFVVLRFEFIEFCIALNIVAEIMFDLDGLGWVGFVVDLLLCCLLAGFACFVFWLNGLFWLALLLALCLFGLIGFVEFICLCIVIWLVIWFWWLLLGILIDGFFVLVGGLLGCLSRGCFVCLFVRLVFSVDFMFSGFVFVGIWLVWFDVVGLLVLIEFVCFAVWFWLLMLILIGDWL